MKFKRAIEISFLFFVFFLVSDVLPVHGATLNSGLIQNSRAVAFTGTITSVRSCYSPGGFAFTVASSSNTYIYQLGPANPLLSKASSYLGLKVFGVPGILGTCDTDPGPGVLPMSGRVLTYLSFSFVDGNATTTLPIPPQSPPNTGNTTQNNGSSGSSGQGLMGKLQDMLRDLFKPPPSQTNSQGGGSSGGGSAGGMTSPFNFGGPIGVPQLCDPIESTPNGTTHLIPIGPPRAGNFLYNPALTKSYKCGPPLITGQNTLGSYTPVGICDLCLGPEEYCPMPGLGFLNALPGHGTSGCVLDTSSPKGDTHIQAPITGCGGAVTTDTKGFAEIAMREKLRTAGISVNHPDNPAGCGYGETFQQHTKKYGDGCSDVSGLQCGAINELQKLVGLCGKGSVRVEGGNELGHATHNGGNAVDLAPTSALTQCITTKFQCNASKTRCTDPTTGTTYYHETSSASSKNFTGEHWHMCYAGKGC